jgi:hypothetical protein
MPKTVSPERNLLDQMPTESRLTELGLILAAGILRMPEKSSSISATDGDSSLAIPPRKSVSRTRAKARVGER